MAEKAKNSTSTSSSKRGTTKSTKNSEAVTVDPRQMDLIAGKTVGELQKEEQNKGLLDKTRTAVKSEPKDFDMTELREAVKLLSEGTQKVSVAYDPRNSEGIKSIASATGIKNEVVYDIAIKRFLDWQDKKNASFPFNSVKDVTPTGTRTTIVISKATKLRLEKFCADNLQQINLIVNLALQGLIEEVKSFNK